MCFQPWKLCSSQGWHSVNNLSFSRPATGLDALSVLVMLFPLARGWQQLVGISHIPTTMPGWEWQDSEPSSGGDRTGVLSSQSPGARLPNPSSLARVSLSEVMSRVGPGAARASQARRCPLAHVGYLDAPLVSRYVCAIAPQHAGSSCHLTASVWRLPAHCVLP